MESCCVAEIICGGRWFITGSSDESGRVWYCDLDAEVIEPRLLFQWTKGGPCNPQRMGLTVNGDADRLSCTVAVIFSSQGTQIEGNDRRRLIDTDACAQIRGYNGTWRER